MAGQATSPRTLTANPSRTNSLRVDGAAGPGAPLGIVGRLGGLDLLGRERIRGLVDRLVDLRLLGRQTVLAVLGGVAQLVLGLLLALSLALAGLGQRRLRLRRGLALGPRVVGDDAADVGGLRGGGRFLLGLVDR